MQQHRLSIQLLYSLHKYIIGSMFKFQNVFVSAKKTIKQSLKNIFKFLFKNIS